jgi:hypothetical protein
MANKTQSLSGIQQLEEIDKTLALVEAIESTFEEDIFGSPEDPAMSEAPITSDEMFTVAVEQPNGGLGFQPREDLSAEQKDFIVDRFAEELEKTGKNIVDQQDIGPIAVLIQATDPELQPYNVEGFIKTMIDQAKQNLSQANKSNAQPNGSLPEDAGDGSEATQAPVGPTDGALPINNLPDPVEPLAPTDQDGSLPDDQANLGGSDDVPELGSENDVGSELDSLSNEHDSELNGVPAEGDGDGEFPTPEDTSSEVPSDAPALEDGSNAGVPAEKTTTETSTDTTNPDGSETEEETKKTEFESKNLSKLKGVLESIATDYRRQVTEEKREIGLKAKLESIVKKTTGKDMKKDEEEDDKKPSKKSDKGSFPFFGKKKGSDKEDDKDEKGGEKEKKDKKLSFKDKIEKIKKKAELGKKKDDVKEKKAKLEAAGAQRTARFQATLKSIVENVTEGSVAQAGHQAAQAVTSGTDSTPSNPRAAELAKAYEKKAVAEQNNPVYDDDGNLTTATPPSKQGDSDVKTIEGAIESFQKAVAAAKVENKEIDFKQNFPAFDKDIGAPTSTLEKILKAQEAMLEKMVTIEKDTKALKSDAKVNSIIAQAAPKTSGGPMKFDKELSIEKMIANAKKNQASITGGK